MDPQKFDALQKRVVALERRVFYAVLGLLVVTVSLVVSTLTQPKLARAAGDEVTRADLEAIQRQINEFRAELAAFGVRITEIEEKLSQLKFAPARQGTVQQPAQVTGDPTAWAEIRTAYAKLHLLPGFRVKMTEGMSGFTATAIMEFALPDRAHMIMQMPQGAGVMEMIRAGDEIRMRLKMPNADAPGEWQCVSGQPRTGPSESPFGFGSLPDPRRINGAVEVARGEDTTINGSPVHSYTYTLRRSDASGEIKTILYVETHSGLPVRTVGSIRDGSSAVEGVTVQFTLDYYDFGAQIDISLPACK
jgi:hypothetical protein